MINKLFYIIFTFFIGFSVFAQQDTSILSAELDEFSKKKKGINEPLRINISGLTLHDFINSIADEHQLNVSVDGDLNQIITNNFYDVTVKDVFLFITEKYDLEVSFMSNIIIFKKKKEIKIEEKKPQKKIDAEYNEKNNFLSLRLNNDSLSAVVRTIADKTGKNIVLSPDTKQMLVSSYILNRPFDQVIDMLAKSNGLSVSKDENDFYFIEKSLNQDSNAQRDTKSKTQRGGNTTTGSGNFQINTNEKGFLSIRADLADMSEIISEAADKLNVNYFFYNKPENEKNSLLAEGITFDDLLEHLFKGKKYAYKKQDGLYLIGEQNTEGLRVTEIIQLQNRSIESVMASLPKIFSEKVEIKEFIELNGLIVSGARTSIEELKLYIQQIDKVVPLVQIEVMIVQYNKSYDIQTGLKAGLDKMNKTTTGGLLFPTTDVNLNASSVNNLIDAFNGLGFIKLGKVTDAFYLGLQFLENNNVIKIESTPKIATISGHEAKLAIGETSYYFEQNNRLINSGIGNDILQSGVWKSTEANLSVSIKPFVSTDENVTLSIVVEKSSFLGRSGEDAPPGKATQKFESLVRVKNNEMVLLGGLDELQKENSGSGTPLISRIPVIKWFFSSRRKAKSTSKLHILIKPIVVY